MFGNYKYISLLLLTLISCGELFFPKTGVPIESSSRRSTPDDIINQLIEGYETHRIELIEDLLADSFQFYVAPSFDSYYSLDYNSESPDTTMQYINNKTYNYWRKKDELYRTKKIFEHTLVSEFVPRPYISRLRYIMDNNGDTSAAELQLSSGVLYLETDGQGIKWVDVDNQIFLLKKDKEGLWVIRKWYDLSSEQSI
jgi:hypothetical protein